MASGMPEWVHVWAFMRVTLKDFRRLPQQDLGEMTNSEYEQVRERWLAAGSPKYTKGVLASLGNERRSNALQPSPRREREAGTGAEEAGDD